MNKPFDHFPFFRYLIIFALPICFYIANLQSAHAVPVTSVTSGLVNQNGSVDSAKYDRAETAAAPTEENTKHSSESNGSMKPHQIFYLHTLPVTNSMISTWIIALLIIIVSLFFNYSLKKDKFKRFTGLIEFSVSALFSFLQELIGESLVRKTFWFLGPIFFVILFLNWAELLPGVGSIGWGKATADGFMVEIPIFRCGSSDLNMTLALGALFFILWIGFALKHNGILGLLLHIFGPKGNSKGLMSIVMIVIFIAVGFLELISIIVRPFSLALRLYGNTLAGGVLIDTMMKKVPALAWLIPLPFYFMEAMVGFVQAFVFTLLSAVFIMLVCSHEGDHEGDVELSSKQTQ